ncbi:MAG: hypothetical protein ACK4TA_20555 [Saprospiraceae bacterium]
MRELREIALLLSKSKTEVERIMEKAPLMDFYEGLVNNKFVNDEEAARHFFDASPDYSNYQKLKSKLRRALINTLFLLDFRQFSGTSQQLAYYECQKEWAAAKLLFGKSAKVSAIALAKRVLKEAKKYEFTDLSLQATSLLRQHYGNVRGDIKKFEYYNKEYKYYEQVWVLENRAEELYIDLIINYINRKGANDGMVDKATEYYNQLKEPMQQYDAYRLHLCGHLIRTMVYSSVNDYENTIKMCDEAIQFFEAKDYDAHMPLQIFYFQKIVCYTQLKEYQKGKAAVERCADFVEEGNYNWFKMQELHLLLALHAKEYQRAYGIFSEAVNASQFQFLSANVAEMWKIYEAFIHYLILIKQIKPRVNDKRFTSFRLNRFLNETPIYSKDKRGMNIPILIVQILLLLHKKKFNALADKMEAIEKYCTRYLRQDDTFRSNCIIKMLLQIPTARFHPAAVTRKVKQYLDKLKNTPLNVANQTHDIEIIPYEDLWEFVIDSLGNDYQQLLASESQS